MDEKGEIHIDWAQKKKEIKIKIIYLFMGLQRRKMIYEQYKEEIMHNVRVIRRSVVRDRTDV